MGLIPAFHARFRLVEVAVLGVHKEFQEVRIDDLHTPAVGNDMVEDYQYRRGILRCLAANDVEQRHGLQIEWPRHPRRVDLPDGLLRVSISGDVNHRESERALHDSLTADRRVMADDACAEYLMLLCHAVKGIAQLLLREDRVKLVCRGDAVCCVLRIRQALQQHGLLHGRKRINSLYRLAALLKVTPYRLKLLLRPLVFTEVGCGNLGRLHRFDEADHVGKLLEQSVPQCLHRLV